jgi:hypothetical protein
MNATASRQSVLSAAGSDPNRVTLVSILRDASRAVDGLWRAAMVDGSGEVAMKLGEASQGIHRALIALDSYPAAW